MLGVAGSNWEGLGVEGWVLGVNESGIKVLGVVRSGWEWNKGVRSENKGVRSENKGVRSENKGVRSEKEGVRSDWEWKKGVRRVLGVSESEWKVFRVSESE